MMKHSFTYNNVDMRAEFGLIVERFTDVLAPELRERKMSVPFRDGAFDYGAKYYEERKLEIQCGTAALMTRGEARRLSLVLAKKGLIRRWDEEDKYYVGRAYNPAEIERVAGKMLRFTLAFVCDPFAYGEQVTEEFSGMANLTYGGTARTPTRIIIRNDTGMALNGLVVTMRERI